MINTMVPDNLPVPALRFLIFTILILSCFISSAFAVSPETLIAALPTASDITPGLDMKNPPGITSQSDDPNYL